MEPAYHRLYALFKWEHRERHYRITFADGRHWELYITDIYAAEDRDEPSHATAEIVRDLQIGGRIADRAAVFFTCLKSP
jgi:hypothetical protein